LQQNIRLEENKEYVSLIGKHLDSIVASFSGSTFSPGWKLTAKESLVADLVKKGKNAKEIGILLKISPRTAETYRNSIRKKIGPLQTNLWVISGTGKYITKSSGISVTAP